MKTSRALPASTLLAAAALASGCSAGSGRLHVPRVYAPLLPGSIYPNKREPIPARGRPGVVVLSERPLPAEALARLEERGLVVFTARELSAGTIQRARGFLTGRDETRGAPLALLLVDAPPSLASQALSNGFAAVVCVGLEALESGPARAAPSSAAPLLLEQLTGPSTPSPELSAHLTASLGVVPVEKWFAPRSGKDPRPPEMWRNAAEWLSGRLVTTP